MKGKHRVGASAEHRSGQQCRACQGKVWRRQPRLVTACTCTNGLGSVGLGSQGTPVRGTLGTNCLVGTSPGLAAMATRGTPSLGKSRRAQAAQARHGNVAVVKKRRVLTGQPGYVEKRRVNARGGWVSRGSPRKHGLGPALASCGSRARDRNVGASRSGTRRVRAVEERHGGHGRHR